MLTGTLASLLEQHRPRYNALVAQARWARPSLDTAAFSDFLRTVIAPIVEGVQAEQPAKTAETANALFEISLDLIARQHLGPTARYPAVNRVWRELLPRIAPVVAASPLEVAGAMTNAAHNLSVLPGARPAEWLAIVLGAAPLCPEPETLLSAGQVAAWRAGMAHFRREALQLCRGLDPRLARRLLGIPDSDNGKLELILDRLNLDPWLDPARADKKSKGRPALKIVRCAGAFRGFGGPFTAPPRVTAHGDDFVVHDGGTAWLLTADLFGATFHRIDPPTETTAPESPLPARVEAGGVLVHGARTTVEPELATATSTAATRTTLAVTTALSHRVYLLGVV